MYPVLRVIRELGRADRMGPLAPGETHVSHTRCWPQDIDLAWELNNGRSLTLFDSGRMAVMRRAGIFALMKEKKVRVAVAGSTVTYRKRVLLWNRIEVRSTIVGTDDRFLYVEQLMLANGAPAHHLLARMVLFDDTGIRPAAELLADRPEPGWRAPLPDWVAAWAAAERQRPWPPKAVPRLAA